MVQDSISVAEESLDTTRCNTRRSYLSPVASNSLGDSAGLLGRQLASQRERHGIEARQRHVWARSSGEMAPPSPTWCYGWQMGNAPPMGPTWISRSTGL